MQPRRTPPSRNLARTASAALLAALCAAAAAQDVQPPAPAPPKGNGGIVGGPPPGSPATPPQGSTRETMWRAPTAEDWKLPCLLKWQRTWEDALAVSKETGKPILICVNMDGEIASEHYAGVRYRQPEIAALYAPYVLVIASVYRHTPRDYDEAGQRIPCPRFGGVTCGEHIAIEPALYEKYFDGERIAPRHVMISAEGEETFDVYYANDTASVFKMVENGVAGKPVPPDVRGDRPIVDRVASPDAQDRLAVESAYAAGDAAQKKALLDAAASRGEAAPIEVLRLAVFGFDADLSKKARESLAKTNSESAVGLIDDALKVPMDAKERDALIAALDRLGATSQKAQWLGVVHKGLAVRSTALDVDAWKKAKAQYEAPKKSNDQAVLEDARTAKEQAVKASPGDPTARVEFAEACLALGIEARKALWSDPKDARILAQTMFDDARASAVRADALGAPKWRTDTVRALAAYYAGDVEGSYERAAAAVKELPAGEPSWNSMAVLTVFAESRWKAIKAMVKEKKAWPPEWIADLNATYTVLLRHPLATDSQMGWHYNFLTWLGAKDAAGRLLDESLARFPASADLHQRLRRRYLERRDLDGVEAAYEKLLAAPDAPPAAARYAAEASTVVGDFHRRAQRRDKALASYERAIAAYERAAKADAAYAADADRAVALLLAGRARIAYELTDWDGSLAAMLASFARSRESAGTRDGVGVTPGETAQVLLSKLRELKKDEAVKQLEEALAKIDPELLRPDRP
jgi:tetratricopeptide (TPR) repeat protein